MAYSNVIETQGADGRAKLTLSVESRARDAPAVGVSTTRRDTGILAAAVTAVPLLVASGITLIPQLDGLWAKAAGISVLALIVVLVGVPVVRSARNLIVGQESDIDVVAYRDDRNTGILMKSDIQNVALRVSTMHRIIEGLTRAIPSAKQRDALYECGCSVGASWIADFHHELPKLQIDPDDIPRQLLKWSEYDATAGMGRFTIAVDPSTGKGLVLLANSFLSRSQSSFPLNYWFAGYLAGSLNKLLEQDLKVELLDHTSSISTVTLFEVMPASDQPGTITRIPWRRPDPRSRARGAVWLKRLKTPLPDELPFRHD